LETVEKARRAAEAANMVVDAVLGPVKMNDER
jgi:hypothetical protein